MILSELEVLAGFIIGGHNINNTRYVLMADRENCTICTSRHVSKRKQEERTKHQLFDDNAWSSVKRTSTDCRCQKSNKFLW